MMYPANIQEYVVNKVLSAIEGEYLEKQKELEERIAKLESQLMDEQRHADYKIQRQQQQQHFRRIYEPPRNEIIIPQQHYRYFSNRRCNY